MTRGSGVESVGFPINCDDGETRQVISIQDGHGIYRAILGTDDDRFWKLRMGNRRGRIYSECDAHGHFIEKKEEKNAKRANNANNNAKRGGGGSASDRKVSTPVPDPGGEAGDVADSVGEGVEDESDRNDQRPPLPADPVSVDERDER